MTGRSFRPGCEVRCRPPFPEPMPPGLNHLVVTATVKGESRAARSPMGDDVLLIPIEFPVRNPDRPQELWTWARCDVEVPSALARRSLGRIDVGAPLLAAGQLSASEAAADGSRRGVIVASIVHPGDPPGDHVTPLFLAGDMEGRRGRD